MSDEISQEEDSQHFPYGLQPPRHACEACTESRLNLTSCIAKKCGVCGVKRPEYQGTFYFQRN